MGYIKIDYEKMYKTSLLYRENAEKIYEIKKEMKSIYDRLSEDWKDNANMKFNNSLSIQIEKLDNFITFLQDCSMFMDEMSNKHYRSEDTLKNNLEKVRDLYEYRD
jgi:uncharacterized protein YukE